jgi:hypothetical protein
MTSWLSTNDAKEKHPHAIQDGVLPAGYPRKGSPLGDDDETKVGGSRGRALKLANAFTALIVSSSLLVAPAD